MDPFARLLEILALLQVSPVWSASALAERTGTTARTVRRDVARLRELGYRIAAAPGPDGGYRLDRGRAVPPVLLTADEAVAVAIGLRAAGPAGVQGLDTAATGALAKLERVLPPGAAAMLEDLDTATVRPDPQTESAVAGRSAVVTTQVLGVVAAAVRSRRRLRFGYTAVTGAVTRRRADPTAVVHLGARWYVVAHDVDRSAWRTFRIDRIDDVSDLGPGNPPEEVPDPIALVRHGTALGAWRWQAMVRLELEPNIARVRVPAAFGIIEPLADGTSLLRIGADDLVALAAVVVGLACPFEVLDPPELLEEVRQLGLRLAAM